MIQRINLPYNFKVNLIDVFFLNKVLIIIHKSICYKLFFGVYLKGSSAEILRN